MKRIIALGLLVLAANSIGDDALSDDEQDERMFRFLEDRIQSLLIKCIDSGPKIMYANTPLNSGPDPIIARQEEELDQSYYRSYGFTIPEKELLELLTLLKDTKHRLFPIRIPPKYAMRILCTMVDDEQSIIDVEIQFRIHKDGFLVCYISKGELFAEFACSEEVVNFLDSYLKTSILKWDTEAEGPRGPEEIDPFRKSR